MASFVEYVPLIRAFVAALNVPLTLLTHLCDTNPQATVQFNRAMQSDDSGFAGILVRQLDVRDPLIEENDHQSLVLVDLSCGNLPTFLQAQGSALNWNYRWLFVLPSMNDDDDDDDAAPVDDTMTALFESVSVLQMSEIFYVSPMAESLYEVKAIYRNSPDLPLIREPIVKLNAASNASEILWTDWRATSMRRREQLGLQRYQINASLVITHNESMDHLSDYVDKHIDTISKVNYLLTNDVANFINATMNYRVVASWGYRDNDSGLWSGMIGELVTNQAQIGASPLFFTADRVEVIQYLSMTSPTRSKFVFRSPKLSFTDNVFLLPFDNVGLTGE